MKLLLDENLSRNQSARLRDLGHDAVAAAEVGLSGEPDERVRAYAIETGRVLVTLDADFANMLRFPTMGTPGVIRLKVHPPNEDAIWIQIERTVSVLRETELAGRLAISSGDAIRIRFAAGAEPLNP